MIRKDWGFRVPLFAAMYVDFVGLEKKEPLKSPEESFKGFPISLVELEVRGIFFVHADLEILHQTDEVENLFVSVHRH